MVDLTTSFMGYKGGALCQEYETNIDLKPLTDVANKWPFLCAFCPSQGVASSWWKVLQLLQRLA